MALSEFDLKSYLHFNRLKIEPYAEDLVRENGIDFRFSNEFKPLKSTDEVFDTHMKYTKEELSKFYEDTIVADKFTIKPHQRVLVKTMEYITMPKDLMGFCNLRSTYARLGTYIAPTGINAGWRGHLVIQMEGGEFPIVLNKGDRFLHVIFAKLSTPVEKGYEGLYQDQKEIVLPSPESIKRY